MVHTMVISLDTLQGINRESNRIKQEMKNPTIPGNVHQHRLRIALDSMEAYVASARKQFDDHYPRVTIIGGNQPSFKQ